MNKIVLLCLVLLLTSCNKNDDRPEQIEQGLILDQTIAINGTEREYHIFVPNDQPNNPVVVLLHGNTGSSDQSLGLTNAKSPQKVWLSIAEQNNFILVVPNGSLGSTERRGWNDCRNDAEGQPPMNDVLFIDQLLGKVQTDYGYNTGKVFIAGVSNGGIMALRLAMEIPEKITAFSAVIASMPENSECINSTVPISALFMNGTDDPIIPYEGGQVPGNRGKVKSTEESMAYWIDRNGTSESPIVGIIPDRNTDDDCTAERFLYTNGTNNTEVALYKITNGGHTEPSISERYSNIYLSIVGNQNADFEMAAKIWAFFKDKSK